MANSEGWQELLVPGRSECPKIFYNFVGTDKGLRLSLTDIVAIWTCRMTSEEIKKAAKKQKTSIDPSESKSQARVLLQKLQLSLSTGNNQLISDLSNSKHILSLRTELDLPKPLKQLQWMFELEPQNAEVLAEELLRPCLQQASQSRQKLNSLHGIIKAKDHVIVKLLDRIESSGTDMSLIFPGITGLKSRKGTVSVNEAKKHISGLAEFSESEWIMQFENVEDKANLRSRELDNLVSSYRECPQHTAEMHHEWLQRLPQSFSAVQRPLKPATANEDKSNLTTKEDEESDDETEEDEFERQTTPPHLKDQNRSEAAEVNSNGHSPPSKRRRVDKITKSTDTTNLSSQQTFADIKRRPSLQRASSSASTATQSASEDDKRSSEGMRNKRVLGRLGAKPNRTTSSSPDPSSGNHSKRKLGGLRKTKATSDHKTGSSRSNSPNETSMTRDDDNMKHATKNSDVETEDEDDDLDAKVSKPLSQKRATHESSYQHNGKDGSTRKQSGRLARLDNKQTEVKDPRDEDEHGDPGNDDDRTAMHSSPTTRSGTKSSYTEPSKTGSNVRDIDINGELENETPEQKADRRRAELKKTLNTTPVRKKRKF